MTTTPAATAASISSITAVDLDTNVPVIRALSESVVNRIAAGEVIHRPSSALKELIENSIDAKANRIIVTINEGGLKAIQIQDNGCGIRMTDFPILCERFTTSKLSDYSDLQSISTFGFRGEALASMTHVAHVNITSMTRQTPCAYRADFIDGKMIDRANGDAPLEQPKPCAGVKGTTILIEDLFYNVPIRRNALKNAHNEEYGKCLDVLTKYALHYSGQVSFSCKKAGGTKLDLNTQLQMTHIDQVKHIYGSNIAKELLPISMLMNYDACKSRGIDSSHFSVTGLLSHANFNQKKLTFILFINNRLVESPNIRRTIDTIYTKYLPKGTHPFVYLSLAMDARILDVNVHPTKKEVHFLYEEQMILALEEAMEDVLKGANKSRVFYTQSILANTVSSPQVFSSSLLGSPSLSTPAAASSSPGTSFMTAVRGVSSNRGASVDLMEEDTDEMKQPAASGPVSRIVPSSSIIPMDDSEDSPAPASSSTTGALFSNVRSVQPILSQTRLPQASSSAPTSSGLFTSVRSSTPPIPSSQLSTNGNRRDNQLVRTDNRQGRIDAFLTQSSQSNPESSASGRKRTHGEIQTIDDDPEEEKDATTAAPTATRAGISRRPSPPVIQLTSVQNLISIIESQAHPPYVELFKNHTFVGYVDHTYSLVQHQTKLYLVNFERVSTDFFYETILRFFGHLPLVRFTKPIPLRSMIRLGLDHKDSTAQVQLVPSTDLDSYATELTQLLYSRASMLHEYFALEIILDGGGEIVLNGIPELLEQYNPPLILLPLFLVRLARDCDWNSEQACFETVANCLAQFYRFQPVQLYLNGGSSTNSTTTAHGSHTSTGASASSSSSSLPTQSWIVSHVFSPLLRHRSFTPKRSLTLDGTITQLASLEQLYKIFERC